MKFKKINLDILLAELGDLPSEWLDDEGRHLVSEVPTVVDRIRAVGPTIDEACRGFIAAISAKEESIAGWLDVKPKKDASKSGREKASDQ